VGHEISETFAAASSSRIGSTVFVVLCVTAIFGVLAYGAVDPLATGILSVGTLIVVVLWTVEAWRSGEFRYSTEKLQWPIIGLIVVGLIQLLPLGDAAAYREILNIPSSAAISLDPYATRMFVIRLVLLLVFLAAGLTFIDTTGRVKKLLIALIAFGTLMGFFGILQKLADPGAIYGLRETPQAIPFGPYVNQHHFASLMVMLSAPVIGLLAAGSLKRDYLPLLWIAAAMMAIAIVFSGSRGGILSYAAMTGIILFISGRHSAVNEGVHDSNAGKFRSLATKFAGIAIIAAALVGVILFLGAGENLMRGLGLGAATDDVSSGRFHFWSVAVQIFLSHPILGAGQDAFGVAFTQFDTRNGVFRVEQAHNEYLQMLADGGILGFVCVAVFIFLFIKRGLAQVAAATSKVDLGVRLGAWAGCIAVFIHSFFDFPLRTHANAYIFLLLVVVALTNVEFGEARDKRRRTV
jgi:O-antigen ligase